MVRCRHQRSLDTSGKQKAKPLRAFRSQTAWLAPCPSVARDASHTPAGLGVVRSFLVYNLVACGILIAAHPPWPDGLVAPSVAVLHGLVAIALLAGIVRASRIR